MTVSLNSRVRLKEKVLSQELIEESILLNLPREEYFELDEIGTRIYQILGETASLSAVFDRLLADYAVDPRLLEEDLCGFAQQLADYGLVEIFDE